MQNQPQALLLALVCCYMAVPLAAQYSIGAVGGLDVAHRRLTTTEDRFDGVIDAYNDLDESAILPNIGLRFEAKLRGRLGFAAQVRYRMAGYNYSGSAVRDRLDSTVQVGGETFEFKSRYDLLTVPIGVVEHWGRGAWTYYAEQFIVPIFKLRERDLIEGADGDFRRVESPERARDVIAALQLGGGIERTFSDIWRVRIGATAKYHLTSTLADAPIDEHLYGVGIDVGFARLIGLERG